METIITLAIQAVEGILPLLTQALPAQLQPTITFLESLIPSFASLEPAVVGSVENIISEISGNTALTASQVAQLAATSAALNAALDAQAKQDGLTGIPTDDDTTTLGT
jgi:hypothetical protein